MASPAKQSKVPRRLYKYRGFSDKALQMLVEDELWFADPSTFNDPLDTKPVLSPDLPVTNLEDVLRRLFEQRTEAELNAAAKAIKYRGPRTIEHIRNLVQRQTERLIAGIRYEATNPVYEFDDPTRDLLAHAIRDELLTRYDKGVCSFAQQPDNPLMWSHYGDQHKGICVGYSVPEAAVSDLHKMEYGGSRLISAASVARMLAGDLAARTEVDRAVLGRKAGPWRYEREWRLLGPRGSHGSPLELEEVIFGMRCPVPVQFAVIRALDNRVRPIKFFDICAQSNSFRLKKVSADIDDLCHAFPNRSLSILESIAEIDDLSPRAEA